MPVTAPGIRRRPVRPTRARPCALRGMPCCRSARPRSELTGPTFGHDILGPLDNDLIRNFSQDGSDAIGQRLVVYGQILDENARPVSNTLVEFWQANAGGRYRHKREGYIAALDPNFGGCGRAITDADGYLPLSDDQAWRLPLAERRQRLAAGPYPLFGIRSCVRAAPDHPNVL